MTWHRPPPGTSTLWLPPMSRLLLITDIWNNNHFIQFTYPSCVICCWIVMLLRVTQHTVITKSFLFLVFHICKVLNAYHTSLFVIFSLNIPPVPVFWKSFNVVDTSTSFIILLLGLWGSCTVQNTSAVAALQNVETDKLFSNYIYIKTRKNNVGMFQGHDLIVIINF